jgi:hypothetical protein
MATNQQKTANLYQVFGTNLAGNIDSLTIANITATGSANLGIIDNVYIGGGSNAQILQTDGNGGLSWTNPGGGGGGGIPGGSNTEIQYNNNGAFDGVPILKYDGSNISLGAVGNVKITGGSSGYYLSTNGSGDLQWAVGTSSNGAGTVTSVNLLAGAGMAVAGGPITSFGNITVTNTGVTKLTAGTGITLTGTTGNITITSSGSGGTVTSVGGDGSGLGFTLTGTVTTSGNLLLTTPTDAELKTTLGIDALGNVANVSLNGNVNEFLTGTGTFANIAVPTGNIANVNLNGFASTVLSGAGTWITPNAGTVTSVSGNGAGLGFTLGSTVTGSGNINLTVPTAATLRSGLNIGNVANLNLNGNGLQVLSGSGLYIAPGTVKSIGLIGGAGISVANTPVTDTGNITVVNTGVTSLTNGGNITVSSSNGAVTITGKAGTVTSVSATAGTGISVTGSPITSAGTLNIVNTGVTSLISGGNISLSSANGAVTITSSASNQVFNMSYATENVTLGGVLTGIYNYSLLDNSITFNTSAATGNVTLNFRGDSTTTLNSLLSTGTSITATYIMTTGITGYIVSAVNIDGIAQTINWVSNIVPYQIPLTKMSFTFTIIKIATSSYTVLGSATRFG